MRSARLVAEPAPLHWRTKDNNESSRALYTLAATDSPEAAVQVSSARCVGDCNLDGGVAIDELTRLVGISLDGAVADPCYPGDADGDARIDIAELIRAVGVALNGCDSG